ncbi:Uncharacterised protein [Mycobacteroides abscessus subsp. abscessus]|nr:Uncharacterised protein [Mycobacteroides abscessus subsp. abscessus]
MYLRKLLNPLRFEISETPFELAAPIGTEDNETKALRLLREHFTAPVGVNEGCRFLSGHGVSMRTEKLKHLVRGFNEGLSVPHNDTGTTPDPLRNHAPEPVPTFAEPPEPLEAISTRQWWFPTGSRVVPALSP